MVTNLFVHNKRQNFPRVAILHMNSQDNLKKHISVKSNDTKIQKTKLIHLGPLWTFFFQMSLHLGPHIMSSLSQFQKDFHTE